MRDAPVITLRSVPVEDWARWRTLRRLALADAPEAFCSTLAEWSGEGDTEERWRDRLASVALNLVAEAGGDAVGMVSATAPVGGRVELISMWVAPSARGTGAGAALVEGVVAWARSRGAREVALEVREHNAPAIARYARQGFLDVGPSGAGDGSPPQRRMVRALT